MDVRTTERRRRGGLLFLACLAPLLLLAACGSEEEKPKVSANLCLYYPTGDVQGPYDTPAQCQAAKSLFPAAECKPCRGQPGK